MNKVCSIFLIFFYAAICFTAKATDATNCAAIPVNKTAFFNLCPFAQQDPFVQNDTDAQLEINFTIATARQPSCDKKSQIWATITSTSTIVDPCQDFSISPDPTYAFLDANNETSGLAITYAPNLKSDDYKNRNLVVWLYCNESARDASNPNFFSVFTNDTIVFIQGSSYFACPYITLSKLINFLDDNKYPFVAVAILLGLFICFFGLRMFNYTVFIITATAATLGSGMLFFEFTKFGTQQWILWVIFGTCVIIGCVLGYLTIVYEKLGFFAMGAGLGIIGGFFIYNTILSQFIEGHSFVVYIVVAVCALVGGGLALWLWKDLIIIASALIGAYMVIRAASVLIGEFPNEIFVAEGVEKLGVFAYIYLGVIVILALVGMYYQFREKKMKEEEEDDEEQYLKVDRD